MAILVLYASKHGSTRGIAECLAEQLKQEGKETELHTVDEVLNPERYEAFVIGSAIYYGSWLIEATKWVHRHRDILSRHPIWLFSSGPLGTAIEDAEQQPKEIAEFQQTLDIQDTRIFFGTLDHSKLSFAERMMSKGVGASEGDFRDWQAIKDWATKIARDLDTRLPARS
ncbi:flavodoxin domain-containing protein [Dictyobacter aurantiacus]|uniref:Flavodoxin n=1 Tax=Dictyobacter aurantiacus TaxID=1936993 RepID=A0A401ZQ67_9CHLR|nr:flavodoxin domain-containing protein [Dictyobacter aurantiacus]GCE09017.1 flavodoxin [Dictyobacter aurantiacus]